MKHYNVNYSWSTRLSLRVFSLICVLLIGFVRAQTISTVYKQYTVEDGLPSNNLNYVMQDSKGYIWVIGDSRALKFNGRDFQEINLGGFSNRILEDSEGNLWICTYEGIYRIADDKIVNPTPYVADIVKTLKGSFVHDIVEDDSGYLWYSVSNQKSKLKGHKKSDEIRYFTVYKMGKDNLETVDLSQDSSVFNVGLNGYVKPLGDGKIIYTGKSYITSANPVPSSFRNRAYKEEHLEYPISHMISLSDGSFLAASILELIHFDQETTYYYAKNAISRNISCLFEDTHKNVWIGTPRGLLFAPEGDFSNLRKYEKIPDFYITSILEDKEDNIWLATSGNGLIKFSLSSLEKIYWPNESRKNNIADIIVHKESLWFVNELGTLTQMDKNNNFQAFQLENISLEYSLASTGNTLLTGVRWTYDKHNKWTYLGAFRGRESQPAEYLDQMFKDELDKVWVAAKRNFFKVDLKNNEVIYDAKKEGFDKRVTTMAKDKNGVLWLLAEGYLHKMDKGSIVDVKAIYPDLIKHMENYYLLDIKLSHEGHLLLSTARRVIIVSPEGYQILELEKELSGNKDLHIDYIMEDSSLWVSAFGGVDQFKYDKKEKKYVKKISLGRKHGLPVQSFGKVIFFQGIYYLATVEGVFIINHRRLQKKHLTTPPVYITSIEIADSIFVPGDEIKLSHLQNSPLINVDGLSFQEGEQLRFWYRMKNQNEPWQKTENRNIKYRNLKPGAYDFEVMASRDDTFPTVEPASLNFSITPHFTQTTLFKIVLFLLGFLILSYLIYSFLRWRARQESRRQIITELKYQALQGQMSPHFIFNAINSISFLVKNNKSKEADNYLNQFAKLIRGVLENAKHSFIPLVKEIKLVQNYLELEQLQFGESFQFSIDMDLELIAQNLQIPPMLLQPHIENAILHGISTRGFGTLKVEFRDKEENLYISIEDDGVGRKKAAEIIKNSVQTESKSQIGLQNIQERIAVLNQLHKIDIRMEIEDLEKDGLPLGTKVHFYFPKVEHNFKEETPSFRSYQHIIEEHK